MAFAGKILPHFTGPAENGTGAAHGAYLLAVPLIVSLWRRVFIRTQVVDLLARGASRHDIAETLMSPVQ